MLRYSGINKARQVPVALGWALLPGLDWAGLCWAQPEWTQLGSAWLGWAVLGLTGIVLVKKIEYQNDKVRAHGGPRKKLGLWV